MRFKKYADISGGGRKWEARTITTLPSVAQPADVGKNPLGPPQLMMRETGALTLGDYNQQTTLATCQPLFFSVFSDVLLYTVRQSRNVCVRNKERWMTVGLETKHSLLLASYNELHFVLFPSSYKSINPFSSSNLCHNLILANLSQPASEWQLKPESMSSCQYRLILIITASLALSVWFCGCRWPPWLSLR